MILDLPPPIWMPSKPAIIRSLKDDPARLAMPLTMGLMVPRKLPIRQGSWSIQAARSCGNLSFNVSVSSAATLILGWGVGYTSASTIQDGVITVGGASPTLIGSDFSYTGTSANVQITVGFHSIAVAAGTHAVVLNSTAAASNRVFHCMSIWTAGGYTTFTKTGFIRSNSGSLTSNITAAVGTFLIGHAAYKNNNNANGYYHVGASRDNATALSAHTVIGTHGTSGTTWSGTAGVTETFEDMMGSTGTTNTNYAQTFCVLS